MVKSEYKKVVTFPTSAFQTVPKKEPLNTQHFFTPTRRLELYEPYVQLET